MTDLIPTMTSDTAPSGVVTSSGDNDVAHAAWKNFDDNSTTAWINIFTLFDPSYVWTQYKFDTSKAIDKYSLTARQSEANAPSQWKLKASNTGAFAGEEVELDSQSGQSFSSNEKKEYSFSNANKYLYYRITFYIPSAYIAVAEIEMGGPAHRTTGPLPMFFKI